MLIDRTLPFNIVGSDHDLDARVACAMACHFLNVKIGFTSSPNVVENTLDVRGLAIPGYQNILVGVDVEAKEIAGFINEDDHVLVINNTKHASEVRSWGAYRHVFHRYDNCSVQVNELHSLVFLTWRALFPNLAAPDYVELFERLFRTTQHSLDDTKKMAFISVLQASGWLKQLFDSGLIGIEESAHQYVKWSSAFREDEYVTAIRDVGMVGVVGLELGLQPGTEWLDACIKNKHPWLETVVLKHEQDEITTYHIFSTLEPGRKLFRYYMEHLSSRLYLTGTITHFTIHLPTQDIDSGEILAPLSLLKHEA